MQAACTPTCIPAGAPSRTGAAFFHLPGDPMKDLSSAPSPAHQAEAETSHSPRRRRLLGAALAGGALAALGAPAIVSAQAAPKIRIGFWPVASGLPFFAAIE